MKIIVHDASVLIDLITADLLEQWLGLGHETIVINIIDLYKGHFMGY